MKKRLLLLCVLIPLAVGGISALLTRDGMMTYQMMRKPVLSPPSWLFPIVWTILYILMGISSYLIMISEAEKKQKEKAILLYEYQLAVNFLWPTFFFSFEWYLFSFFWLLLLWILVLFMILSFWKIDKRAALLNIPYLVWLTFAGYLNLAIWWLN